jgi:putative ubiquitin-RnfH superfamily antitoxin RatB of RatAB toxin-antitoxin module
MRDVGLLMGKRIALHTSFALPGSGSDDTMMLPEGVETVADLLGHMGDQINFKFFDLETGRLEEDLEIILNEKEIWFYPSALNTPLQDGDKVEIYLLPLGGG